MATCNICCNTITTKVRREVACGACDFGACAACVKQFLLSSPNDAACMNCKHPWSFDFLSSNLEFTFINGALKKHRETVLMDREMALMPATQPFVEQMIRKDKLKGELRELLDKRRELSEQIDYVRVQLENLDRNTEAKLVEVAKRSKFVRACVENSCKGFLNDKWTCGLCNVVVCSKCHVKKVEGDEHECKEDDVATATLLAKDSKPCPSCACMIFKIDGCDQMFCTSCHTAFSWKTGEIERKHIHNPHYYDWLRKNNGGVVPREPGDVQAGQQQACPRNGTLESEVTFAAMGLPEEDRKWVMGVHRLLQHVRWYEFPKYTVNGNGMEKNRDLRVKYMRNEFDMDKFKRMLQLEEKKRLRMQSIRQVLETFRSAGVDMMNALAAKRLMVEELPRGMVELRTNMEQLAEYVNENMRGVGKQFKVKVPIINMETKAVVKVDV